MSLQITNLTRLYGKQKAIDSISFSVKEGEIMGFLGPNGAGKSTTMKIITGYLTPSTGYAVVNGLNVTKNPLSIKKTIGYLPEQNPLYLDMYMHEYLHFVGSVHGIERRKRKRCIENIIIQCGLVQEQGKKLGALSKGYKQRVGLAQALIHDPKVLVLDEPTAGLDPNQIVEIRTMIKAISQHKTVLFSTHIMQEVQALCDRVVIINKGKIIANDRISTLLKKYAYPDVLVVQFQEKVAKEALESLKGVSKMVQVTDREFQLSAKEHDKLKDEIRRYAVAKQCGQVVFKDYENTMENIFRQLTANDHD